MNERHAEIDKHAEAAHQEGRALAQRTIDEISVKVGWMLRSMGAKQGWVTRRNNQKEKTA